jgi:hypothetical protein
VKLSKTLIVPLAGLLLVGAAGAALATSAGTPVAGTGGVILAAESQAPASPAPTIKAVGDDALTKVLGDLVTKGTITETQKTAIQDALGTERAARMAARKAAMAERKALQEKVKGFLADGVITKDELDQLPADHPLRQLTTLMADGKITLDELKALGGGWRNLGVGGGHGWMRGGWGGKVAPNATASPTTGG